MFVKMEFGSTLYGLDTPESDKDYKGIFLPDKREVILNRVPKTYKKKTSDDSTKNTSEDTDFEAFSIYEFIRLALNGETVALDMLHAQDKHIVDWNKNFDLFNDLRYLRSKFYCTDMKAYMGYVRRQAAKYGVKGSRLATAKEVLNTIENYMGDESLRVGNIVNKLPKNKYCEFVQKTDKRGEVRSFYQVCGRKLQYTLPLTKAYEIVKKIVDSYGHRAKQAENNKNIDWKAVSHALRAGYQLRDIYRYGDFSYPLKESQFLFDVKNGKLDFKSIVQPELEGLVDEVDLLSELSDLPSKADRKFWEDWLYDTIENRVIGRK